MKRLFLITFFALATNLSASVLVEFAINTSSLAGQSANLDFQFLPDGASAAAVTAGVTGFVTDGTYDPGSIILTNDATGALPNTLVLDNGTSYNDAFQPISLGTFVDFVLTLSGAGIDNPDVFGSTFAFSIYDSAGTTPLLTTAQDGSITGVTVSSVVGVAPYTNPAAQNGSSAASAFVVPEPATYSLISLAFVAAGLVRRLRR